MKVVPAGTEPLADDDAYLLSSRAVLRLAGETGAPVLQALVTNIVPFKARAAAYAAMLDSNGHIAADMFILDDEDDLLIDCDKAQTDMIVARLNERAGGSVEITDETANWRVFGQLNNQSVFDDGTPYMRFADPRRHEMGNRILRPSSARESVAWRHEGKWRGHAYRLGIATGADVFARVAVSPLEANLHALNGLDARCAGVADSGALQSGRANITRRILPFRIEPSSSTIPAMAGEPVTAGSLPIGAIITSQKLYGLALIELAPWREALRQGHSPRCCDEAVIVKWPTWLGRESNGRLSPAAAEGGQFQSFENEK